MLEKIDLKQSLKKDAYNEKMSYFETRLGELQRACRAAGIPVIILFEGWRGSQRSVIINHMMQQMDARGFRVIRLPKWRMKNRINLFLSLSGGSCRQKAIWLCITAAGTI